MSQVAKAAEQRNDNQARFLPSAKKRGGSVTISTPTQQQQNKADIGLTHNTRLEAHVQLLAAQLAKSQAQEKWLFDVPSTVRRFSPPEIPLCNDNKKKKLKKNSRNKDRKGWEKSMQIWGQWDQKDESREEST